MLTQLQPLCTTKLAGKQGCTHYLTYDLNGTSSFLGEEEMEFAARVA